MALQGTIRDASGTFHTLQGDSLDLETVVAAQSLLAYETAVFAAELESIHIEAVAE